MIAHQMAIEKAAEGQVVVCVPGEVDGDPMVFMLWRPPTFDALRFVYNPDPLVRATFLLELTRATHEVARSRGVTV